MTRLQHNSSKIINLHKIRDVLAYDGALFVLHKENLHISLDRFS